MREPRILFEGYITGWAMGEEATVDVKSNVQLEAMASTGVSSISELSALLGGVAFGAFSSLRLTVG